MALFSRYMQELYYNNGEEGPKHQEMIPLAIECFLGKGVKRLKIIESEEIYTKWLWRYNMGLSLSEEQIKTIARKCPNLTYLNLRYVGIDSWPFGTIFSSGLVVEKGVWTWKLSW